MQTRCSPALCILTPLKMPSSNIPSLTQPFLTQLRHQTFQKNVASFSLPPQHPWSGFGLLFLTLITPQACFHHNIYTVLCNCLFSCPLPHRTVIFCAATVFLMHSQHVANFPKEVRNPINVNWMNWMESSGWKRCKSHCVYSNVLCNAGLV